MVFFFQDSILIVQAGLAASAITYHDGDARPIPIIGIDAGIGESIISCN